MMDHSSSHFEIDRLSSKRIVNILYCPKEQFARYEISSCAFTDNLLCASVDFRKFTEA